MYGFASHDYYTRTASGTFARVEDSRPQTASQASSVSYSSASDGSEYSSPALATSGRGHDKDRLATLPRRTPHFVAYKHSDDPRDYSKPAYHLDPRYEPHAAYKAGLELKVPPEPLTEKLKGPWQKSEDEALVFWAVRLGTTRWVDVANRVGSRTGKQCRERWTNQLSPDIDHSPFRPEEDELIIRMQASMEGNHWREVAKYLPGRPENTIKNRFNSTIVQRKRAELLGGCYRGYGARFPPARLLPPPSHEGHMNPYGFHGDGALVNHSFTYNHGHNHEHGQTHLTNGGASAYPSPSLSQKRGPPGDFPSAHGDLNVAKDEQGGKRVRKLAFLDLHQQGGRVPDDMGYPSSATDGRSWPATPITPSFIPSANGTSHTAPSQFSALPVLPAPAGMHTSTAAGTVNPNWTTEASAGYSPSGSVYASSATYGYPQQDDAAGWYGNSGGEYGQQHSNSSTTIPSTSSASSSWSSRLPPSSNQLQRLTSGHLKSPTTASHEPAGMRQVMSDQAYAAYQAGYAATAPGTGSSYSSIVPVSTSDPANRSSTLSKPSSLSSSPRSPHSGGATRSHDGFRQGAPGSTLTLHGSPRSYYSTTTSSTAANLSRATASVGGGAGSPAVNWTTMEDGKGKSVTTGGSNGLGIDFDDSAAPVDYSRKEQLTLVR